MVKQLLAVNACFLQRFLSHMVIKLYFCLSAKLFLQFLKVNLGNYQQRDTLGTDFVRLCCFCQKIIDAKSLVLAHGIFGLYFMLFKAEGCIEVSCLSLEPKI